MSDLEKHVVSVMGKPSQAYIYNYIHIFISLLYISVLICVVLSCSFIQSKYNVAVFVRLFL